MEFKIGDKVFLCEYYTGVGVVVDIDYGDGYLSYLVHSQAIFDGHDGNGYGKKQQDNCNNWWFAEDELKLFDENKELEKKIVEVGNE